MSNAPYDDSGRSTIAGTDGTDAADTRGSSEVEKGIGAALKRKLPGYQPKLASAAKRVKVSAITSTNGEAV